MSVASSWAKVKGDMNGHGTNFMIALFAAHPQYQNNFPKLKGKSASALKGDAACQEQGVNVLQAVDKCVAAGGDKGAMAGPLGAIATTHVPRGIKLAYFQDAFDTFVSYVGANAGGDQGAWKEATDTIMAVLTEEYKKKGGS